MKITAFWDTELCSLNVHQNFRVLTSSIIITPMMEAVHTTEISVYLNDTISQKAVLFMLAAMRT